MADAAELAVVAIAAVQRVLAVITGEEVGAVAAVQRVAAIAAERRSKRGEVNYVHVAVAIVVAEAAGDVTRRLRIRRRFQGVVISSDPVTVAVEVAAVDLRGQYRPGVSATGRRERRTEWRARAIDRAADQTQRHNRAHSRFIDGSARYHGLSAALPNHSESSATGGAF